MTCLLETSRKLNFRRLSSYFVLKLLVFHLFRRSGFLPFLVAFQRFPRVSLSYNFFRHCFKERDSEESCLSDPGFPTLSCDFVFGLCLWTSWQRSIVTYLLLSLAVWIATCYSYYLFCIDLMAACFWQSLLFPQRQSCDFCCFSIAGGKVRYLAFAILNSPCGLFWFAILISQEFQIDQPGFKSDFSEEYSEVWNSCSPYSPTLFRKNDSCLALLPYFCPDFYRPVLLCRFPMGWRSMCCFRLLEFFAVLSENNTLTCSPIFFRSSFCSFSLHFLP